MILAQRFPDGIGYGNSKGEYRESEILTTNRELTKFADTGEGTEGDTQYITNVTKKYF